MPSFSTHLRNKEPRLPTDYSYSFAFYFFTVHTRQALTYGVTPPVPWFWAKSLLPGWRLSHAYYSCLGLHVCQLAHMDSSVLSIDESAAVEHAPGSESPRRTWQMAPALYSVFPVGAGPSASLWPPVLLTIWCFQNVVSTAALKNILSDIQFNN